MRGYQRQFPLPRRKRGQNLLVAFVEKAYSKPSIMVALTRKLLPDMKAEDINLTGDNLTDLVAMLNMPETEEKAIAEAAGEYQSAN